MALLTSLVSWWKMDEASGNAIDAHGSNDLTDTNTVGTAAGKVGNARDFESSNSEYFTIASNATLQTGDIDFTFVAWVNLESKAESGTILQKRGADIEYIFRYEAVPDRFVLLVSPDGSSVISVTANTFGSPPTGVWIFVLGWHDSVNNLLKIQVNDGTVESLSHTTGVHVDTEVFNIGANFAATERFDGLIDEVAFWKRTLTTHERDLLYNSGDGVTYEDLDAPPTITTTTLPDGAVGDAYSQTLASTGGTPPKTWSVTVGALPDGLTLNASTGEISGTPTVDGTFSFTVEVEDDAALTDTQALSITIEGPFGDFVLLDQTGMRLEEITWTGGILRANFGRGFGARALPNGTSGLHRWSLHSGGVWPDLLTMLTIEGVSRFEYYWEFFKTHTTGTTDIFVILFREAYYHASFVDDEINVNKFKNMLLYEGGVEIRQRRVAGVTYNDDGSFATTDDIPEEGGGGEVTFSGSTVTFDP